MLRCAAVEGHAQLAVGQVVELCVRDLEDRVPNELFWGRTRACDRPGVWLVGRVDPPFATDHVVAEAEHDVARAVVEHHNRPAPQQSVLVFDGAEVLAFAGVARETDEGRACVSCSKLRQTHGVLFARPRRAAGGGPPVVARRCADGVDDFEEGRGRAPERILLAVRYRRRRRRRRCRRRCRACACAVGSAVAVAIAVGGGEEIAGD